MQTNSEKRHLMSIQEAADYLGISLHTLYGWVNMKKLPYYKIGRFVKFDIKDLNVWIESQKIEAFVLK